ncbi:MAG: PorT family protein [Winogradskyella sp.]|uniref:outer membrane beta-barrel protein n=1 Tax=Winogradskyella sp. TaxID=1883156 RepID=UPI000F3B31BD|nr:outer membrane beta-barrel protein [Winogradskyella sp.]RNC87135.1 MAG: PorT family protein [Winogradskyella sp.]
MKYFALLLIVLFYTEEHLNAQNQFGIKGGTSVTFFNQDQGIFGENPDIELGYFAGVFVDFNIEKGFHIQPELLYKGIGDFEFLNLPIYLKYDIDYNLHILAGPSMNYFFNFFSNKFKVRGDISLAYDINEKLDLNLKYTIGFEEISPDIIFLGLGYRL